MALFYLQSTNKDISYIVRKNPESGMKLVSNRQGMMYGWFCEDNMRYNVYFQDGMNEVSYKVNQDDNFEYMNEKKYNSPIFVLDAMRWFFDYNLKKIDDKDKDWYTNEVFINMINVEYAKYIDFYTYFGDEFEVEYNPIVHKTYSFKIKTKWSIHRLLNFVGVFVVFLALISEEYIDIGEDIITKYLGMMNNIDTPYFARYMFKKDLIKKQKMFDQFKENLEKSERYKMSMTFGSNFSQRIAFVAEYIWSNNVIDIWCWDGQYLLRFAPRITEWKEYFAIDIDEEKTDILQKKINKREIKNAQLYNSIDSFLNEFDKDEKYDIVFTELLEHLDLNESKKLVGKILKNIKFNSILITTPNKSFNKYYNLDEKSLRNDDHKFEFDKKWFEAYIDENIVKKWKYKVEFVNLWDSVEWVSTCLGCIIKTAS